MCRDVEFSIQQFNVIYQVIKEIDNISIANPPEELGSQKSFDQVLRTARSAKRAAKGAAASRVVFTELRDPAQQHQDVSTRAEQDNGVTIVRTSVPMGHLSLWSPIVDFIVQNLGEREVFLRAGYTLTEINSAKTPLPG